MTELAPPLALIRKLLSAFQDTHAQKLSITPSAQFTQGYPSMRSLLPQREHRKSGQYVVRFGNIGYLGALTTVPNWTIDNKCSENYSCLQSGSDMIMHLLEF